MIRKQTSITEQDISALKKYLDSVEFFRKRNLPLSPCQPNWMAEQHAREISGWLSIYENGTDKDLKKLAEISLLSFLGRR